MWNRVLSKLRRDAGLSVVLALQAAIMFIVGPLAATGYVPPVALDAFRFGLAAAAVLMLTRSRLSALIIGVTFTASLILSFSLRSGGYETPVYVVRLIVTLTLRSVWRSLASPLDRGEWACTGLWEV